MFMKCRVTKEKGIPVGTFSVNTDDSDLGNYVVSNL